VTNTDSNGLDAQFLREKEILDRCAPRTVSSYRDAWKAFARYSGEVSGPGLKAWVMAMTEAGLTPRSINSFASGVNSF